MRSSRTCNVKVSAYNHSDSENRYVYEKQQYVVWWNLYRLAEALSVVSPNFEKLESVLIKYRELHNEFYTKLMGKKLRLINAQATDLPLIDDWLSLMLKYQMDFTYSWRKISLGNEGISALKTMYNLGDDFNIWYNNWQSRLIQQNLPMNTVYQIMQTSNPAIILRNSFLQEAISKAQNGDYSEVEYLFNAISYPYQEIPQYSKYYSVPPSSSEDIELSCSS